MKTVQIIKRKFSSSDYYGLMACNLDKPSIFPLNRDAAMEVHVEEMSVDHYLTLIPLPVILHNGFFCEYFEEAAFNFMSPSLNTEEEGYYKAIDKVCAVTNVIKTCTIPLTWFSSEEAKEADYKPKSRSKTYLMLDRNTGLYKIGRSYNPLRRESTLQSEKPSIELLFTCNQDIEATLHNRYKTKRVRGEWFNLSCKDIIDIKHLFKHTKPSKPIITMETPLTDICPDAIGHGQSQRYEIIGEPLVFMAAKPNHFHVTVNNMDVDGGELSYYDITFDDFAARYPDCDGKFVTCFQYDSEGYQDEKELAVWDFIYNVFYSPDEPYFNDSQKADYKELVIETLLNIIEGRY